MAVATLLPIDGNDMRFMSDASLTGRSEHLSRLAPLHTSSSDLPKSASFSCLPTITESERSMVGLGPTMNADSSLEDLSTPSIDTSDRCPTDSSGWTTPSEDLGTSPDLPKEFGVHLLRIASDTDLDSAGHDRRSSGSAEADDGISLATSRKTLAGPFHPQIRPRTLMKTRGPAFETLEAVTVSVAELKPPTRSMPAPRQPTSALQGGARQTLLQKSFSTDRLHAAPLPLSRSQSYARKMPFKPVFQKRKDELWPEFRVLNEAYAKFSAKSMSFKATVVRQSLLPFLRGTVTHTSVQSLRAEDLDRRVTVLHKWWSALLELLHGKNNQSLSGTDRPAVLAGITGLMERPEWRVGSARPAVADQQIPETVAQAWKSSNSLSSSSSESSTEPMHNNVRAVFEQALVKQMVFVTEKMSLRNASASLVTFCGKAVAYAFFYCPQIADILVRHWPVTAEGMKRVLRQYGAQHMPDAVGVSDRIKCGFPAAIQSLAFTSASRALAHLRTPITSTGPLSSLQMYGYWNERWLGRDSDLFYTFVKSFFVLSREYLTAAASSREQVVAPAMLLVQTQLLATLDATLNRDCLSPTEPNLGSATLDDFLTGPDTIVAPLPLAPPNAFRQMSENRLVMLLRDCLSDRSHDNLESQHLFAASFHRILVASACSISLYSHLACYTLCDFLEEALTILSRYDQRTSRCAPVLDLTLWIKVFEKMLESHNTVTEVRLYALIYTVWPVLSAETRSRETVCLDFLLTPDRFERGFLHWCPMVRAYFMRLICWRLSRYDENASNLDDHILVRLRDRLQAIWCYHQQSTRSARNGKSKLSCAKACAPAPGRRFMIVRTDTHAAPGGAFMAFNGIAPPLPTSKSSPPDIASFPDRGRTMSSLPSDNDRDMTDDDRDSGLRNFIRGMMGTSRRHSSSRRSNPGSATATPPNGLALGGSPPSPSTPRAHPGLSRATSFSAQHSYCFKFSLEFVQRSQPGDWGASSDVQVLAPRLPLAGQRRVQQLGGGAEPGVASQTKRDQPGVRVAYAGRALSEWMQIVAELQNFLDRRRAEGVTEDRFVETPTLAVEFGRR